ncbi:MAG: Ig-like domain repeat protein [Isosphaeraceae bacterium]
MTGTHRFGVESFRRAARGDTIKTSRRRRGRPRTFDALERRELLATVFTVNSLADAGTGSNNAGDLRYCINQANAVTTPGGSEIVFDPTKFATAQTITLTGGQLELSDTAEPVSIVGPTAGVTVNGNKASRVFLVDLGVSASISGLTITDGVSGANGGGLYNLGTLQLTDCTVTGNSAAQGGGIEDNGGATLTNCTISGNSARNSGGGLLSTGTTTTLTGCTISGNSSLDGGGVYNSQSTVNLTNCTISGNTAHGGGGGWLWGTTTLSASTVSGNSAPTAGGLYMYTGQGTLTDSIVAGNAGTGGAANDIGQHTGTATGTNNLIGTGGSDGLTNGVQGNLVGVANPGLGTLGNYGGATQTIPLLPGSPALGAGTAINGVSADQRGEPIASSPDIGAFQSQGFTLTPAAGSTPQVVPPATAFNPLALTVTANNPLEPVAGGVVNFTVNPATGGASASLSAASATIGANGTAQVGATANATNGSYTVSATTAGAAAPAVFSLSNDIPLVFGGLASPTVAYGTPTVTLGGTLSDGTHYPSQGESVVIAIGGDQQSATIGANGTFSIPFNTSGLTAVGSPYTVTYSYAGDATNHSATATGTLTLTPLTPTVGISDTGGTFNGGAFAATSTVTPPGGTTGPSLEGVSPVVSYYSGAFSTLAQLAGQTPMAGAPVQAGTYTAVARFGGSADYTAATSSPVVFTIQPAGSSVSLGVSSGSTVYGQPVTLVATVSSPGGVLGGTVTYFDGSMPIGSAPLDGTGTARLTLTNLGVGGHTLTASYSGEGGIQGGTSGPASESVAQDATQIVLTTHAVRKKRKVISVTLDAQVEPVGPGGGTPTGNVALELRMKKRKKFLYRTIAQMPLAGGVGSITLKPNQVLRKALFLSYGGDGNFTASTLSPSVLTPSSLARSATAMAVSPIVGTSHPRGAFRIR